jgi:hypothetical protein
MKKQEVLLLISCISLFNCFNLSILLETLFPCARDFRSPATQKATGIYRNLQVFTVTHYVIPPDLLSCRPTLYIIM